MGNSDIAIFQNQLSLKQLENELLKQEQVEIPVENTFSGGVYIRQVFIPKGTLVIGKRHRLETCNMLLKGDISIYMGENVPVKRLKGPCIFTSEPGAKKMGYTHEDTIFANIHPTTETDLEKIEAEFIIPEEEYEIQQIEKERLPCPG